MKFEQIMKLPRKKNGNSKGQGWPYCQNRRSRQHDGYPNVLVQPNNDSREWCQTLDILLFSPRRTSKSWAKIIQVYQLFKSFVHFIVGCYKIAIRTSAIGHDTRTAKTTNVCNSLPQTSTAKVHTEGVWFLDTRVYYIFNIMWHIFTWIRSKQYVMNFISLQLFVWTKYTPILSIMT